MKEERAVPDSGWLNTDQSVIYDSHFLSGL